jgi:putative acetyltransferase
MSIELEHIEEPTDEARALIAELDAELSGSYASDQRHGLTLARIFRPGVLFFIARLDGQPAGCGGIAFDDGAAELKRMYVRPQARGRDVARTILLRLEQEARARGFTRVVLETGDAQLPAIRFYQREGFTRCEAFGVYAEMPSNAIIRSVFFEKLID